MDVQQLEYQAPLVESPRARPGKPPVAPEADLARGDRDWSLIDALRQREPIAAERLVATYGDRAYRVAIRITGNAQDAEEVVQDAFWSVVRNIDSFRGAAAFGSWIYRIVANAAYHTRRRGHGRRRDRSLAEASPVFDRDGRHQEAVADWSARLDNPSALSELRLVLPLPQPRSEVMNALINALIKLGLLKENLDYHLVRASMVVIFLFFGYQKWFEYEAQVLIPFISHGPFIFWLYPLLGIRGATWFLGVSEWSFCALLFLGFWNKELGILGALGAVFSFVGTITIIPFMPDGWAASAGGFPAMTGNVAFLMKDLVLLAASIYLLKQDVTRVITARRAEMAAAMR